MILPRRRDPPPLRRLDSRVSRRGLLAAGVLAGVLAASGVPVAARERGGVLRLALAGGRTGGRTGGLPEGGDWAGADPALILAAHETLTEIGPEGALLPGLAEAWDSDAEGRDWLLRLRRDARLAEGGRVEAADVVASLARARAGRGAWALARVAAVEAQGAHAVRLRLSEGDRDLPFRLAEPALAVGREGRLDGRGSGLYAAAETGGGRVRLLRVEGHRRDGEAGWFDAVEALAVPDPLAALAAGEADAADLPGPEAAAAEAAGLSVVRAEGHGLLVLRLPEGLPRAADLRSDALLSKMIDREAIAAAWGGSPAANHPLGPLHPFYAPPRLRGAEADGRLRLSREPWLDGFDPELRDRFVGRLGFDPADHLRPWHGRPTEDATFDRALAGPWASCADRPGLRAHLAAARRAEGAERAAALAEAQFDCCCAPAAVVAAHVPTLTAHAPALAHGPAVSGLAPLDGGRIAERWWSAA